MQMEGERRIAAARDDVWQALNDPEILQRCIPGCRSVERDGEGAFRATADVKLGPVKAVLFGMIMNYGLFPDLPKFWTGR